MKSLNILAFIFFAIFDNAISNHSPYLRKIHYPVDEQFSRHCQLDYSGIGGVCKRFEQCASAQNGWFRARIYPTLCYYHGFEAIICCVDEGSTSNFPHFIAGEFPALNNNPNIGQQNQPIGNGQQNRPNTNNQLPSSTGSNQVNLPNQFPNLGNGQQSRPSSSNNQFPNANNQFPIFGNDQQNRPSTNNQFPSITGNNQGNLPNSNNQFPIFGNKQENRPNTNNQLQSSTGSNQVNLPNQFPNLGNGQQSRPSSSNNQFPNANNQFPIFGNDQQNRPSTNNQFPSITGNNQGNLPNSNDQFPIFGNEQQNRPNTNNQPSIEPSLTTPKQRISDKMCDVYYRKLAPGEFGITVVGGELAKKGEFPFMAAIGWNNILDEIEFNCGGFLISPNFILTAAHCTTLGGSTPDIIRIGDDALNTTSNSNDTNPSEDITIERIFVHPNYNPKQTYNDIALIKLTSNSSITPTCLWQSDIIIGEYSEAEAIGYGHTQFAGTRSNYLMKVTLDLIENFECNKSYPPGEQFPIGIINTQMCAGDSTGVKDTCQGDSGGPILVKDIRNTPFVTGITSFGSLCASGVPSVYTRVSSYLDWIEPIVWS